MQGLLAHVLAVRLVHGARALNATTGVNESSGPLAEGATDAVNDNALEGRLIVAALGCLCVVCIVSVMYAFYVVVYAEVARAERQTPDSALGEAFEENNASDSSSDEFSVVHLPEPFSADENSIAARRKICADQRRREIQKQHGVILGGRARTVALCSATGHSPPFDYADPYKVACQSMHPDYPCGEACPDTMASSQSTPLPPPPPSPADDPPPLQIALSSGGTFDSYTPMAHTSAAESSSELGDWMEGASPAYSPATDGPPTSTFEPSALESSNPDADLLLHEYMGLDMLLDTQGDEALAAVPPV